MKEIPLTKGMVALVDDEDYDYLNQFKWYSDKIGGTYYAKRDNRINGQSHMVYMHREILHPPSGMVVDHKDHNGLNNQKTNIRICTVSQNLRNSRKPSKSKYRGVRVDSDGYIIAYATINKSVKHLGVYKTEEDAAIARDIFVYNNFGEFAQLNFPRSLNTRVQREDKTLNQRNREWLNKFGIELSVFNSYFDKTK